MVSCMNPNTTMEYALFLRDQSIYKRSFIVPNITFNEFSNCDTVLQSIQFAFPFNHRLQKKPDVDVAFQMIHDNYEDTKKQVDFSNWWFVAYL